MADTNWSSISTDREGIRKRATIHRGPLSYAQLHPQGGFRADRQSAISKLVPAFLCVDVGNLLFRQGTVVYSNLVKRTFHEFCPTWRIHADVD